MSMADPPKEYTVSFPTLSGGLNLWELDYRLEPDQSPEMRNMFWLDGALSCRDGQKKILDGGADAGYCCYEALFHDRAFFHIGTKLYWSDPRDEIVSKTEICTVPEHRGSFFRYGEWLMYKSRGCYKMISFSAGAVSASDVAAYTPIIVINAAPGTGSGSLYQPENRMSAQKTVWYNAVSNAVDYYLPVSDVSSVDAVVLVGSDGTETTLRTGYTVTLAGKSKVTFTAAPPVYTPAINNTVRITYTKANADAQQSVSDCDRAVVYGGEQNVCVVFGGSLSQPNAYFWSGNHTAMDPGYFPVDQYNLAGDASDPITGFGKQQGLLVVFKEKSIGKASLGTVTVDSRVRLTLDYTSINANIGCDLPNTIQLVQNNLVFCNTEQGVHIISDSSAAKENNVVTISKNVNGNDQRPGLLYDVRNGSSCSVDDNRRYWLVSNGHAYVWDYILSAYDRPSWFYFTNITAVDFFRSEETLWSLGTRGMLTLFARTYTDYDGAIDQVFRFATQNLGGYDRLKNVRYVIFSVRSDTDLEMGIEYLTDYETRADLTPVRSYSWSLVPRNLKHRFLGVPVFAGIAKRRPMCGHIRHFAMRLSCAEKGCGMSIISAQIIYVYSRRDR